MSYKGHDLDLRPSRAGLPREEAGAEARRPGSPWNRPTLPSSEPIAVDNVVLDCCNGAHDVARFHGAREVRPEHLLHALTRVAAAAAGLEEPGIRIDQLRRLTAMTIAAEAPDASADAASAPVASPAFEDILRRAADEASRRQSPATIQDVVRALLSRAPESPAAAMLLQAASDPQRLVRWRDDTGRPTFGAAATALDPADEYKVLAPAVADAVLRRLGALEAAFQSLHASIAADRTAMGDLLRELRAELVALRASRPSAADGTQRLAFEGALEARLGDLGRAVTALSERSAALDKLVASNPWEEMRARVEAVEGRVSAESLAAASGTLAGTVSERLGQAEAGLQRLREETERHWNAASERQQALEASVHAGLEKAEEARRAHERDLGEIYEALLKLGTNQHALGDNFTTWRAETSGDLSIISARLEQLDNAALDMLSRLSAEVHSLLRGNGAEGSRLGDGFKRWLYGTSNILATGWRSHTASTRDERAPLGGEPVPPRDEPGPLSEAPALPPEKARPPSEDTKS
jgi:ClpA/ClpB-like protein